MSHSKDIPDLAGCTIDHGRLKLVRVLGSGSSGVTYLAEDTTPGASPAEYAVKCMIRAEENTRRYALQQQEIKFHKLLSPHPNVVTLHSVFYHQYYIFLVMDYCRAGDLFTYLSERREYRGDDGFVKELFSQILDAVEACHQVGIFHRDIKPENFLVDEDASGTRLFLTDFGLATINATSETYGAGSSLYMSPECIGDYAIRYPYHTRANDIWALGVILLSMISGHNPWNNASLSDPCYVAYRRNANFLRQMLPISRSASYVLSRIFRRERAYRIGLVDLREEIASVGTFFMHPAEIASGPPYLREAARMYFANTPHEEFFLTWADDPHASVEEVARAGHEMECDIAEQGVLGSSFSSSTVETDGPDTPQLRVRHLIPGVAASDASGHEPRTVGAPLSPLQCHPSALVKQQDAMMPRASFLRRLVGRFRAE